MKVVIAGNGIAGNEVAFSLKKKDRNIDVLVVSAEDFPEYDPCSLPYFVAGDVSRDAVFKKSISDYENAGIELVLNDKLVSIDPASKEVKTEGGRSFRYDKLILAHGGSVFVPPIPGVEMAGVFMCKKLSDADALYEHHGEKAVVIGSGAIGIEVAEALKKRGFDVCIVELLDWILPTLCCESTARRLEESLKKNGIEVYTSERVLSIEGEDGSVIGVKTDKRYIPCDTVVVATGVVPGRDLAKTAGIDVNRGIKVNGYMETSVRDIYACGDCVETFDTCTGESCVYQLKHNAIDQARVVVENLTGRKVKYAGAYAFARIHFFDTHAVSFGKTLKGVTRVCSECCVDAAESSYDGDYLRLILKDGKIVGGQAIGDIANFAGLFISAMFRGDDIKQLKERWKAVMSFDSAYPWFYKKMGQLMGLGAVECGKVECILENL